MVYKYVYHRHHHFVNFFIKRIKKMYQEIIISAADNDQKLQRWLQKRHPNVPYDLWQKWFRTKQIRYNGQRANGNELLAEGKKLRLPPFISEYDNPNEANRAPGEMAYTPNAKEMATFKSTFLFEDDHILVINKPFGLAVQGGTGISRHVDGLVRILYPNNPPKLVHRLDKETSGILILAKTLAMAQTLTKAFEEHTIRKEYLALVDGVPEKERGSIITSLEKSWDADMEKMAVSNSPDAKESKSTYKVLSHNTALKKSLLIMCPKTGRTHQLRVHCQHMGWPIMGDRKYNPTSREQYLYLHAFELKLPRELGYHKSFRAPLPDYFMKKCFGYKLTHS